MSPASSAASPRRTALFSILEAILAAVHPLAGFAGAVAGAMGSGARKCGNPDRDRASGGADYPIGGAGRGPRRPPAGRVGQDLYAGGGGGALLHPLPPAVLPAADGAWSSGLALERGRRLERSGERSRAIGFRAIRRTSRSGQPTATSCRAGAIPTIRRATTAIPGSTTATRRASGRAIPISMRISRARTTPPARNGC